MIFCTVGRRIGESFEAAEGSSWENRISEGQNKRSKHESTELVKSCERIRLFSVYANCGAAWESGLLHSEWLAYLQIAAIMHKFTAHVKTIPSLNRVPIKISRNIQTTGTSQSCYSYLTIFNLASIYHLPLIGLAVLYETGGSLQVYEKSLTSPDLSLTAFSCPPSVTPDS